MIKLITKPFGKASRQLQAELHKFKLSVMKIYSRERKSSEGLQGKVYNIFNSFYSLGVVLILYAFPISLNRLPRIRRQSQALLVEILLRKDRNID